MSYVRTGTDGPPLPSRRAVLAGLGSAAAGAVLPTALAPARARASAEQHTTGAALANAAAAMPKPLLGGYTRDLSWYQANVGPVQIRRNYDTGFSYPTWQKTFAYREYGPTVRADYSFQLPPAQLAAGVADAILKPFLASTPKDIILTNYHEPEDEIEAGRFSAKQFRDSITHLAKLVRAQNALDGGHRRVSVVLMYDTVYGFKGRNPLNYWPGRDAAGVNYANLISFDTYGLPHMTHTPGVPTGYTDGLKWQTSAQLLDPSIAFARKIGSPWMVSEFGFLEDIHKPTRKADAITDFVNYARLHGAVAVEYWDSFGTRGDWQLRYRAKASHAWKTVVDAA